MNGKKKRKFSYFKSIIQPIKKNKSKVLMSTENIQLINSISTEQTNISTQQWN